ncbi:hypothetical protein HDV00_007028 [Rhizophlyctis rosea]|nr:hypothetical protein HDV00_007028 [Rhizophlyctis rosea]
MTAMPTPATLMNFGALVLQRGAFTILVLRTSLFADPSYFPTTALVAAEALRCACSTLLHTYTQSNGDRVPSKTALEAFGNVAILGRMLLPAVLSVAAHWLQHAAAETVGLDKTLMLSQIELFLTAVLWVVLLRRSLGALQWLSICLLSIGAALTQLPASWWWNVRPLDETGGGQTKDCSFAGVALATLAATASALAAVMVEKILKETKTNVWILNIRLAVLSGAFTLILAFATGSPTANDGTWTVESGKALIAGMYVVLQAAGAILTTTVILSSDNIVKGFATALGAVLAGVVAFFMFPWVPAYLSIVGTLLVAGASYVYYVSAPSSHQYSPANLPSSAGDLKRSNLLHSKAPTIPLIALTIYVLIYGLDILGIGSTTQTTLTEAKRVREEKVEKAKCNVGGGRLGGSLWGNMTEDARQEWYKEDPWASRNFEDPKEEVEYIRYLTKGLAVNDTIVFIPTNDNFLSIATNLECSLRRHGLTNVLFWALDAQSNFALRSRGYQTYFNPSLYGTSECVNYHEPDYNRMMRERPKVWGWFLEAGVNFLWMDADISTAGNPLKALRHDADLEIQSDGVSDIATWIRDSPGPTPRPKWGGCAGLFHIRAHPRSIRVMNLMQEMMIANPEVEDQQTLQYLIDMRNVTHLVGVSNITNSEPTPAEAIKHDKWLVRFADPRKWVNGHQMGTWDMGVRYVDGVEGDRYSNATAEVGRKRWWYVVDGARRVELEEPLAVHVNSKKDKVEFLKEIGMWFLDEGGRCLL